jgi:RNA polymerase sigma-70 factor (ECF subfamily)
VVEDAMALSLTLAADSPIVLDDPDAQALAAWITHGDRGALLRLFARHAAPALRLAGFRLAMARHAEAAVRNAFLAVMRDRRPLPAGAGGARGRILAAVLYACSQQARSQRADVAEGARSASAPPDPGLRDAVERALAQLPEHQRQPLELHFLGGLGLPEISAALGRSERAVRGEIDRGIYALCALCTWRGAQPNGHEVAQALHSLASPEPTPEAVARCAAVAASGPLAAVTSRFSSRLLYLAIAFAAILAALTVAGSWCLHASAAPTTTSP